MSNLTYSFFAILITSFISFIGASVLFIKPNNLDRISYLLVSFAVGSLLGDAFIHLLPESYSQISSHLQVSLLVLIGMLIFFSLEKFFRWHHCHDPDCADSKSNHFIPLNLFGDFIHNFIDGMLITASFSVSLNLGIATSLAVIFHEIPQEIGDFGVLIHGGIKPLKALKLNFISALASFLGMLLVILIGVQTNLSVLLLPLTAGGFIYLAASDLIPELHQHGTKPSTSINQIIFMSLGVLIMVAFTFFE